MEAYQGSCSSGRRMGGHRLAQAPVLAVQPSHWRKQGVRYHPTYTWDVASSSDLDSGLPADQEGEKGSSEARARGGDAAANLQGMRMILSSASGQGRVLEDSGSAREKVVARAPPYDAVRHRVVSSLHGKGCGPRLGGDGARMHPCAAVWYRVMWSVWHKHGSVLGVLDSPP